MAQKRPVTAAEARGAAAQVLDDGADAVYLFNYFPSADPTTMPDAWVRDAYEESLSSLANRERIELLSRTHAVTFADMIGPEGSVAEVPRQLPAEGVDLLFELPTGPRPTGGCCELVIGVVSTAEVPLASVNDGAELSVISVVVEEALRRIHYTLPVDDLVDGGRRNRIRIRLTSEAEPVRVEAVEIRILPV
jgi:hypothetical protein